MQSLSDQLSEDLTDIGNMNITPDTLSLSNLETRTTLQCSLHQLRDLDTALVDRSPTTTIDQRREHERRFWTGRRFCQVEYETVDETFGRIALDELADLLDSFEVVVYFVRGFSVCVLLDVGEGKESRA